MNHLYVPNETFLVCSSGMHVQKMKVDSQSTVKIDGGELAATLYDRTGGNFICGKMVIAGAIAGAIVGAIFVATGGIGFAALGAAVAAGAAVGAVGALSANFTMPCLCAIFTMPYDWTPVHPKVKFAGKKPLIETSKLPCMWGGEVSIYFSEEAAQAQASYNIASTALTVGSIIAAGYLGGLFVSSLGLAAVGMITTYISFGAEAVIAEAATGFLMYEGAKAVNNTYDAAKQNIKYQGHSLDSYVSGEKYEEEYKNEANAAHEKEIDDANKTLAKVTDGSFDAKGRALDGIKELPEKQVSKVDLTNTSSVTTSENKVFLGTANGEVIAPGNVQVLNANNTVNSSNPIAGAVYNNNGGRVTAVSSSVNRVETANLINTTTEESITTSTTQFNTRGSLLTAGKGYANTMLNAKKADFWKSGFGLIILLDLARAIGNKLMAEQIKGVIESAPAEAAAKRRLSVLENEI
jgi:hypothetical protein